MMRKTDDEIVAEIRRRREAHATSLDYDVERIAEDIQRQERASGASFVDRPARQAKPRPRRSLA